MNAPTRTSPSRIVSAPSAPSAERASLAPLLGRAALVVLLGAAPAAAPRVGAAAQQTRAPRLRAVLKGHSQPVYAVAFSPDGRRLASLSDHQEPIRLWNAETGEPEGTLDNGGRRGYGVAFDPSGRTLAGPCGGGELCLWDLASRTSRPVTRRFSFGDMSPPTFSPDGRLIAAGSAGGAILFEAAAAQAVSQLEEPGASVSGVAFSADGALLAAANMSGDTVTLWDVTTRKPLRRLALKGPRGVAISPDRKAVAAGNEQGQVMVWDAATGSVMRSWRSWQAVPSLAFSPNGQILVTGSWQNRSMRAPEAEAWDWRKGRRLWSLPAHTATVWAVAFSPDGSMLATGSWDKTIRLYDWATPAGRRSR